MKVRETWVECPGSNGILGGEAKHLVLKNCSYDWSYLVIGKIKYIAL